MKTLVPVIFMMCTLRATTGAAAQGLAGRWKLLAAEDIRADGTVARYPWGRTPIGSIVVEGDACCSGA